MAEVSFIEHSQIDDRALRALIRKKAIALAGHKKSLIYGRLNCGRGKRMKRSNRIFFATKAQAKSNGFRPCGHCLRDEFALWQALHP
jgi:methylphosphotriester-DNA--protein-cysteine methyltransferase